MRTKHHAQWIKEFHRFMGDIVAQILAQTSITPTQITVFRFLCGVFAAVLISLNMSYRSLVLAAFCLYLFSMLDAADGSLARIQKTGTMFGAWLDRQFDGMGFFLIFTSIGIRFAQNEPHGGYWALLSMSIMAMAYILKTINITVRINYRPVFEKVNILKKQNDKHGIKTKKSFRSILKTQIDHDFHTVSTVIIISLLINQLRLIMALFFVYLLIWWFIKTAKIANLSRKHDELLRSKVDS